MNRRINSDYVNQYKEVVLTQPIAHEKYIKQNYEKVDRGWKLSYSTDSTYHICPYDGVFRNCKDCGALDEDFDIAFCTNKTQVISTGALVGRIKDCIKAGLDVQFYD